MHNHNIIYLIEGNLQTYKPFLLGKTHVDKYALMSSMVSINYYKGFSLYKSNSLDESAEWLIQVAFKLDKEGDNPFYIHSANTANVDADKDADTADNYSAVMKRTKKNNITPENIGEIILNQIPGVSSAVAIVIMEKFKTIKSLIEVLSNDKKALDGFKTIGKEGKSRKISKTSIQNIYSYLAIPLAVGL
jgi:ERCC4-type nuclease